MGVSSVSPENLKKDQGWLAASTEASAANSHSLTSLLAHHLQSNFSWKVRQTIWYSKSLPTFSDALALVRRYCWAGTFSTSSDSAQMVKVPLALFERLRDLAVYAA
jgi:hypothetical protein